MPLASGPGFPVALVVAAALLALVVVAGVVVSRIRRTQAAVPPATADTAGPAPAPEPEPEAPVDGAPARPDPRAPGTVWGLHVPGTPVQRMAKSLAVGFAMIDPEETSRVVHSADDGANWWVLPRERWGEDV
ncbi:MAG: hypothetical protein EAS51_01315 [Microbacteriaceae bacterium]|nr:MAG: hypothetical protein EAS51_01315 [Microbacteriaceae bacterium]